MKGYGQFCPVAKACEIVAERWTPLVLRELFCGSYRFSDLQQGVPLMSRTLLAQRLEELEEAGGIRSGPKAKGRGREYHLAGGRGLGRWGQRWARGELPPGELDAALLMWEIVVRFDLRGVPRRRQARATGGRSSRRPTSISVSGTPASTSTSSAPPTSPRSPGRGWATCR